MSSQAHSPYSEAEIELIRALREIQLEWGLDPARMAGLCHIPVEAYESWTRASAAAPDRAGIGSAFQPAVALVAVYRKLKRIYPRVEEQAQWLARPNSVLDGNRPLDVAMGSPEDLLWLAYCLDSMRPSDAS